MQLQAILLGLLLTGAATGLEDTAPDGHRSVGQNASLHDILALFRNPKEEDEAFLGGLASLEGEMRILAETTEGLYRSRGLLDVLDGDTDGGLPEFHRRLFEFLEAPVPFLTRRGDEARLWGRIFFDVRIRIRAELFADWERDAEDVRDGLALLRANTDGWVRTEEEEAQLIAKRIDLAGALLRARIKDLSAVRETPGQPSEVRDEDVDRLLQSLRGPAGSERDAALDEAFASVDRAARRMRGLLFTSRLRVDAQSWIRWRDESRLKAEQKRQEVRLWQPQTEEGKDAPREIRIQKKTTRRREAFARALEGLSFDPFDDELAYATGLMAEFVSGALVSLDFYDRFLALHGIRTHDDRTWPEEPTDEEEHAIFQIQQYEKGLRGERPGQEPGADPGTGTGTGNGTGAGTGSGPGAGQDG